MGNISGNVVMQNDQAKKPVPIGEVIEAIVVSFIITYGLHYFGAFWRTKYFTFCNGAGLGPIFSHLNVYGGHIFFIATFALYALAVKSDRKYITAFFRNRSKKTWKWLLLGAVTGFGMMGICILSAVLHGDIVISARLNPNIGVFILALFVVFMQASTEELESRVFLFGRMNGHRVPVVISAIVSSLFFAFLHAANPGFGLLPFLSIISVGLFYVASYYFFGSIWFTCAAHTLWNFSQDFIFGLPDSGNPAAFSLMDTTVKGDSFFYDEVFGIEGSWMAILMNLLGVIVVVVMGIIIKKKAKMQPAVDVAISANAQETREANECMAEMMNNGQTQGEQK